MMNSFDEHITELIPAYALDSLDPEERLIADAHLRVCEFCKAEFLAFSEVVGELAYSVHPVEPRSSLKKQIMDQLPSRHVNDRTSVGESLWQRIFNLFKNSAPVWSIASLLLIIFLGASNLVLRSEVNDLIAEHEAAKLPVVNLFGTEVKPDAVGVIVVSEDGAHGTLIVDGLPILDESRQYQLWLIEDGTRVSGGVFSVSDEGYGSLWVDSPDVLSSYSAFGITIEPYGGSPGPTGDKVLGSDV